MRGKLSSQHLQQQISQMKREASSTSRLNVHNRRRLFGGSGSSASPPAQAPAYPAMGTSSLFPHHYHQPSTIAVEERGISTSTSFNNSLQEHAQQQAHNQQKQQQQQNSAPSRNGTRDFKRRAQLSQSVYLSSAEPTRQSQTRLGRPLNEQKSSRFAKSADFQSSNLAFGEPTAFQTGELKKHGSNSLLQWFKQGVRKLRNSLHRSISREDWPARSMPSFPMLYQNTTTANSLTPTMHQPSWASKAAQHQGRLRTATANRGSSGDIYPLHSAFPHIDFDRGSSVSNLRRCLSLAENQNREIGSGGAGYGGGNIMPFSMEVIPETDLQASSQNLGPNSYLQRDSTMEQIFAWQQGAPSLLSLNATPNGFNGVEKSSQSDSRQLFQGPAFPDSTNPSGPSFYESRHEPLPANNPTGNNYMARSGRDSGFIDIPSHQNFAQVDSSAYSVIHSRQLSEPQTTQEPLDVKQITDAFEGLASDALKGSPSPPPPPQIPQMVLPEMDSWWASGAFTAVQQNSSALGGGMCQNWNIYQNGIFTSNPSGAGGVGETQSLKAK
ncbi:unnamed protein product [Hymenolepis diminuta]|uniref:Protein kinase domain-containing protein n=1 Tax=Hymenolepis diminuta TaxID=6216 RepID=A0A158QC57_HYMDI|nr:unnamed protein product [Hymenolepis diminuta]